MKVGRIFLIAVMAGALGALGCGDDGGGGTAGSGGSGTAGTGGSGTADPVVNVSGGNTETADAGIGVITMHSGTFNQLTNNIIVGQVAGSILPLSSIFTTVP